MYINKGKATSKTKKFVKTAAAKKPKVPEKTSKVANLLRNPSKKWKHFIIFLHIRKRKYLHKVLFRTNNKFLLKGIIIWHYRFSGTSSCSLSKSNFFNKSIKSMPKSWTLKAPLRKFNSNRWYVFINNLNK